MIQAKSIDDLRQDQIDELKAAFEDASLPFEDLVQFRGVDAQEATVPSSFLIKLLRVVAEAAELETFTTGLLTAMEDLHEHTQ